MRARRPLPPGNPVGFVTTSHSCRGSVRQSPHWIAMGHTRGGRGIRSACTFDGRMRRRIFALALATPSHCADPAVGESPRSSGASPQGSISVDHWLGGRLQPPSAPSPPRGAPAQPLRDQPHSSGGPRRWLAGPARHTCVRSQRSSSLPPRRAASPHRCAGRPRTAVDPLPRPRETPPGLRLARIGARARLQSAWYSSSCIISSFMANSFGNGCQWCSRPLEKWSSRMAAASKAISVSA